MTAGAKARRQWEIGYWTVKHRVAMSRNLRIPHEHATGSQMLTREQPADWRESAHGRRPARDLQPGAGDDAGTAKRRPRPVFRQ